MPGKVCPQCGKLAFYESPFGMKCTKCGYKMIVSVNEGKGGKGKKCTNCGQFTVFGKKCRSCGARYK